MMLKRVLAALFIFAMFAAFPPGAAQLAQAAQAGETGLGAKIALQIIEALPWDKANVEVTGISIPGLEEAGEYDDAQVRMPRGMAALGKTTFPVSFFKNGMEVKSLWASARIKVYKQAVVALKPIRANRMIDKGDIRLSRVDVRETQDSMSSVEEVAGMFAKRPIRAGTVIKNTYVKPELLVKRGDRVVVSVEGAAIKVKSKGTAAEDGSMGRTIAVRTASGREINGRVVGPGEIAVEF